MSSFNAIPLITDAARRRFVFLPISVVVQSTTFTRTKIPTTNITLKHKKTFLRRMIARLASGQQRGTKPRPLLPPTHPSPLGRPAVRLCCSWQPAAPSAVAAASSDRSRLQGGMCLGYIDGVSIKMTPSTPTR